MGTTVLVVGGGRWLAEELSATTLGVEVAQTTGLFLPTRTPLDGPAGPAWWMPCSFAARLLHAGYTPTLTAPGPRWLTEIPTELTGRRTELRTVADTIDAGLHAGAAFTKLAEAKTDDFPATWRTGAELLADLARADLPPASLLQTTSTRLDLACEFRCYVLDTEVLTSSLYLRTDEAGRQVTHYDGASATAAESETALCFARETVAALGRAGQPAAYTLDVGYDRGSGRWLVIEGNPAWSSAWYGCSIDAVLATILRSCQPDPGFTWVPDEYYRRESERCGKLR